MLLLTVLFFTSESFSLEPSQILVLANKDIEQSVKLAEYYCLKRKLPKKNILKLSLGSKLTDEISREDYLSKIKEPALTHLKETELLGQIKCILTTYGVPFIVGPIEPDDRQKNEIEQLKKRLIMETAVLDKLKQQKPVNPDYVQYGEKVLAQIKNRINYLNGKDTDASLDSELSMILVRNYNPYRWSPNHLKGDTGLSFETMMVCRIDGPGFEIAKGLIDKALAAEQQGLKGTAYIDTRDIEKDNIMFSFGSYDQSLRDLAKLINSKNIMSVQKETTDAVFKVNSCPRTALYCGWYSLKKYIDAFDFVDGAIGFHIASFEAQDLRNPNSTQWVPAMLTDGITVTLGPVAEPYLHAFPMPHEFFSELFDGKSVVEAFYYTKRFNSWRMMLIGDPLYTPFPRSEPAYP